MEKYLICGDFDKKDKEESSYRLAAGVGFKRSASFCSGIMSEVSGSECYD